MDEIISIVRNIGGLFSGRINQTDIFIVVDENNKTEILNNLKYPFNGAIMTYQEFIDDMNV